MSVYEWPKAVTEFAAEVQPPAPGSDGWYFVFHGNQALLNFDDNGQWQPISLTEAEVFDVEHGKVHFLGYMQDVACFTLAVSDTAGREFGMLRSLLGRIDDVMFSLAGRAVQIVDWYRSHQFCGRCGAPADEHARDRALVCAGCGIHTYPRLSPSIIVLIHRGEEVLLARNVRFPEGMYSTLAGFVEPGESIEDTVRREVMEEVGVSVRNITYYGSQPWPFPNSLMLGFHAEYDGGEITLQEEEIADAQWFNCADLPQIPGKAAISRWLIDAYLVQRGIPLAEK